MDQNPFICFPGDGSGAPARVREQDASSPSAAPGQDALPAQAGAAGSPGAVGTAARAGLGPQAPGGWKGRRGAAPARCGTGPAPRAGAPAPGSVPRSGQERAGARDSPSWSSPSHSCRYPGHSVSTTFLKVTFPPEDNAVKVPD